MNKNSVLMPYIMLKPADGFQKGLAFDIAHSAAHFDDGNMCFVFCIAAVETAFDFIGDMRDDLYGSAAVISPAFFLEHRPVDFSCGDIGVFCKRFVYKTLIMAQIQIGFSTVVSHEDLPVLYRIHGSGIDVDIWIEFLHGDLVSPRLQQASQGGGGNAFSKAGDDSSGYKYIFHRHRIPSS